MSIGGPDVERDEGCPEHAASAAQSTVAVEAASRWRTGERRMAFDLQHVERAARSDRVREGNARSMHAQTAGR